MSQHPTPDTQHPIYDLGFLGGGQLARMSIMAAQRIGLSCVSLDPGEETPASILAPAIVGRLDDPEAIAQIFKCAGKVTLENEFIPATALREGLDLAGRSEDCLLPGIETLATIQDKLSQRRAYEAFDVPSPHAVELTGDGGQAIAEIGFPMVLKARFGGYDGKGTRFARTLEELEVHRHLWEKGGWLAETWVEFRREIAVMAFVSADGHTSGEFPVVETVQKDGVCDLVIPFGAPATVLELAASTAGAAVHAVGGRGLFGVEMFETNEGEILVNEIAPRPHNSGHYTLDWNAVSQFEQHVRLVLDLPLGAALGEPVCMANLFGQANAGDFRAGVRAAMEGDPGVRVHWYGKAESRPGRKMGHINVVSGEALGERAKSARDRFYSAWTS
jgi:5-(carboxyamino)imidazole ribonucleotide synthase